MSIFAAFDRVIVISLPERKDRRRVMERQGFAFEYFNAIRPADKGQFATVGFRGSYLSHLAVLSHGGSVLILEDDCTFTASDYRVPVGTDIFYGGYEHASDPNNLHDSNIIGAHCMGFSARAAKLASSYLSGLLDGTISPDPRAVAEGGVNPGILPPIDGAYVWFRRAHPELVTVFRKISKQWPPSRSDCTPGRFDGIPTLRPLLGIARQLKAALG